MLHITSTQDGEASWQVRGLEIAMESFTDYGGEVGAHRRRMDGSIVEIPSGTEGVVYFGEADERPDLVQVRRWYPEHEKLWQAVRDAYWDVIAPRPVPRLDTAVAYDYTTGEWDAAELRETGSGAGDSE